DRFRTRSDLERLRELDLTGRPGLGDLPEVLGRSPFRDGLKVLRCGPADDAALDLPGLARALGPARLATFGAPEADLGAADLREFLESPAAGELTSLDLRANQVGPDAHDAFRNTRCRPRELDLSFTPLGAIGLDSLLSHEPLADLRVLNLNGCGSAMANVRAVAGSRFW